MTHRLLALLGLSALALALVARADEPATKADPKESDASVREKSLEQQQILNRQFTEFEASLLRLAQRLEQSKNPEDRERAANLKKAIVFEKDQDTRSKFDKLITTLQSQKFSLKEIKEAMRENEMLVEDIRTILAFLMTDNRDEELKRQQKILAELIKQIEKAIRDQKIVRTHTDANRMEADALAKLQDKAAKQTEEIARAMGRKDKEAKSGDPKEGKNADPKEGKSGEPKEGKNADPKKGKSGDPKEGKSGEPKEGKSGDPKEGKSGNPQEGKSGDPKEGKSGDSPPSPNGEQDMPGRKQVQDANEYQRKAEEDIKKDKKEDASKKEDKAVEKLESAKKELEKILKQLREEEIERILAALQARCETMLLIQRAVYEGTVVLNKTIISHPDPRPERADEQKSLQLSDRENEIVKMADQAIQLLQAEGTAVAFPEVFIQVRGDMSTVARRLGKVDSGTVTQAIEKDIIKTLEEMVEALKKQRQDRENQKSQPGQSGPPMPQSLVDALAELKMIRSMQLRINTRTVTYAEQYVPTEGEETRDPEIARELKELSDRQEKILEVVNNLYRGKNK